MAIGRTSTTKGFQDPRYRGVVAKLVTARKAAKLSQSVLAARLNRHQQFVSRYESGERRLDIVEMIDIATALAVDPVELVRFIKNEIPG